MTSQVRPLLHHEITTIARLPANTVGLRYWIAEIVHCDAPLGVLGENALRASLAEDMNDRRARSAVEGGICQRGHLLRAIDRRHGRRSW